MYNRHNYIGLKPIPALLISPERLQGCQFGTILGANRTFLLHINFHLALKLFQTGNPERERDNLPFKQLMIDSANRENTRKTFVSLSVEQFWQTVLKAEEK